MDWMKNEVLMQLFVDGPTWDGNLISKQDRNELVVAGLAGGWDGWNLLTAAGVRIGRGMRIEGARLV